MTVICCSQGTTAPCVFLAGGGHLTVAWFKELSTTTVSWSVPISQASEVLPFGTIDGPTKPARNHELIVVVHIVRFGHLLFGFMSSDANGLALAGFFSHRNIENRWVIKEHASTASLGSNEAITQEPRRHFYHFDARVMIVEKVS